MPDSERLGTTVQVQSKPIFAMATHPGLRRRKNEDFCAASPAHRVFLVADGMGGAASGEIASRLAAETALAHLVAHPHPPSTPAARLRAALRAANRAVYQAAGHDPQLRGMGTTLVAALLDLQSSRVTIVHVGDSRAYLLRSRHLRLLTADHTVVEQQVQAGHITREESRASPLRHLITRAVGSRSRVQPEIQSTALYPGDLLLLASDGLNRELPDSEIESILTRTTPETLQCTCAGLIEAANAKGGRDNITVLLLAIS